MNIILKKIIIHKDNACFLQCVNPENVKTPLVNLTTGARVNTPSRNFSYLDYIHETKHNNEHAQSQQLANWPIRCSSQMHFRFSNGPVLQTINLRIRIKHTYLFTYIWRTRN